MLPIYIYICVCVCVCVCVLLNCTKTTKRLVYDDAKDPSIRLVSGDSKKKTHSLHGVYQLTDSEVNIRLALRNIKSGSAKVNVASTFQRNVIPDGVRVLP